MGNPIKSQAAENFALLLMRLALGATFFGAGTEKLANGVRNFVNKSSGALPHFLPTPIGQTYLYAVPFFEVLVGALLILGLLTRPIAFIATLMLISFSVAVTGVFMDGNWHHPTPNMAYLAMAILLLVLGAGSISMDRRVLKVAS